MFTLAFSQMTNEKGMQDDVKEWQPGEWIANETATPDSQTVISYLYISVMRMTTTTTSSVIVWPPIST